MTEEEFYENNNDKNTSNISAWKIEKLHRVGRENLFLKFRGFL